MSTIYFLQIILFGGPQAYLWPDEESFINYIKLRTVRHKKTIKTGITFPFSICSSPLRIPTIASLIIPIIQPLLIPHVSIWSDFTRRPSKSRKCIMESENHLHLLALGVSWRPRLSVPASRRWRRLSARRETEQWRAPRAQKALRTPVIDDQVSNYRLN